MIAIGSLASRVAFRGIAPLDRTPQDWDFIARPDEYQTLVERIGDAVVHIQDTTHGKTIFASGYLPIEVEIAHEGSSGADIMTLVEQNCYSNWASGHGFAGLPVVAGIAGQTTLLLLKLSHRYKKNSPHFLKTMRDIQAMRRIISTPEDLFHDLLKKREKETYSYNHPKLNQSKGKFFADDGINYVYDHDTIHEAVKLYDRPAFEYIKKDKADVLCSKEKFLTAPEHIKLATVLEESYVLALERCLIPFGFDRDPKWAFEKSLEKVCTSIASGWWREYAWENYDKVVALYQPQYVNNFEEAHRMGRLAPYQKEAA